MRGFAIQLYIVVPVLDLNFSIFLPEGHTENQLDLSVEVCQSVLLMCLSG